MFFKEHHLMQADFRSQRLNYDYSEVLFWLNDSSEICGCNLIMITVKSYFG